MFTTKEKCIEYKKNELKKILHTNKGPISIRKIDRNSLGEYLKELKQTNIDGVIVDYPYNWTVFKFKKNN